MSNPVLNLLQSSLKMFTIILLSWLLMPIYSYKISKCHYEGDIELNCDRTNMLSDTKKVIRYARLINGLYFNDSLCSFVPGTSCYRDTVAEDCLDKASCTISNGWYSLEPYCAGHSYYSQVEYDCQPAYHMCETHDTVINNEFSGIIYSPNYPNSFRTDSDVPCFMTIHLPKNHHVQITLDYFNILKTKNCIGDYIEIQEYVQSDKRRNRLKRSFNYENEHKSKQINLTSKNDVNRSLTKRQNHGRKKFRWRTLGPMCGHVESRFTLRAKSDIVNIKFRPLPLNHQYLKDQINQNFGFKIYFEAVPPEAPIIEIEAPVEASSTKFFSNISPSTTPGSEAKPSESLSSADSLAASWIIIIMISGLLFILIIIGLIILTIIKQCRRSSVSGNKLDKKSKSATSSSKESSTLVKTKSSSPPKPTSDLHLGKSSVAIASETISKLPKSENEINKTKRVVEEEPRKIQTELPALLQDLGTSRLLAKYKQSLAATVNQSPANQEIALPVKTDLNDSKTKKSRSNSNDSSSFSLLANSEPPPHNLNKSITVHTSEIYDGNESTNKVGKTQTSVNTSRLKDDSRRSSKQSESKSKRKSASTVLNKSRNKSNENCPLLDDPVEMTKLEITENDLLKITLETNESELNENNRNPCNLIDNNSKIEIVEDLTQKELTTEEPHKDKNLVTFSLPPFPSRGNSNKATTASNADEECVSPFKTSNKITTPRKPAFNPLHVILKDKNKYYTTEYI